MNTHGHAQYETLYEAPRATSLLNPLQHDRQEVALCSVSLQVTAYVTEG